MSDLFVDKGAIFSPCKAYRYRLWRIWDPGKPLLYMLMLNPSTADESVNDPTVERCERRARREGFGGLVVLNIFAFRATDPDVMKAAKDPVGPVNDQHLLEAFKLVFRAQVSSRRVGDKAPLVCAGRGAHGDHLGRHKAVERMAREAGVELHCLALIQSGQPKHPLYCRNDAPFIPWSAP